MIEIEIFDIGKESGEECHRQKVVNLDDLKSRDWKKERLFYM